jgi:hypothetical protein
VNPVCRDTAKDDCGLSSCAPTLTTIQLVKLPIKAEVGYPVGFVTKKVDILLTEPTNKEGYLFV